MNNVQYNEVEPVTVDNKIEYHHYKSFLHFHYIFAPNHCPIFHS